MTSEDDTKQDQRPPSTKAARRRARKEAKRLMLETGQIPEGLSKSAAKNARRKIRKHAERKAAEKATANKATKSGPKRPPKQAQARKEPPKAPPKRTVPPKVGEDVKKLLEKIGVPKPKPFKPDNFQVKAAELAKEHDVIVTAPTGSGKTWIAKKALACELERGRKCWYASPLKALSNSKYLEFGKEFGKEAVGLLTGDHKINTKAPILVGTTEILRNQLYDSMSGYGELDVDLVVLDEAHYIGDGERGMVWEEILIYMPARVRFLLLSATILNAKELAAWLEKNRERPVKVVSGGKRPVPLEPLCLDSGLLTSIYKVKEDPKKIRGRREWPLKPVYPESHLRDLAALNLLPAIFFLKSRKDCDAAVRMARIAPDDPERRALRTEMIDAYAEAYSYLAGYPGLERLKQEGLASHHAGHLPQYKMLVEELMSRNLLSAIFATSTVAAGVNFPARTVVIPQSDRFNGKTFEPLSATELAQMTGRAGRRGLDLIGFAVVLKGPFQNIGLMQGLFNSEPDPVRSALKINFSMVLNLLRSYEAAAIPELLSRSLAAWQEAGRHTQANLKRAAETMVKSFEKHMDFLSEAGLVTPEGKRLTENGLLAAALRVQHPLVLFEAISKECLPSDPESLAAVMTLWGDDPRSAPNHEETSSRLKKLPKLAKDLVSAIRGIFPMACKLKDKGFPAPSFLDPQPAMAVYEWAVTHDYKRAIGKLGMTEFWPGDLVRHVLLAGEHLNQLANLEDPRCQKLAETAKRARKLIMVEPMV